MRTPEELRYLILAAQREGNRLLAQRLRPLGLTPSQAEVLRVLEDLAPLTLTGLGEVLVCETGTNPSRLVDRLVAAGAVSRRPGAGDRRAVELTLTPEGAALARRVRDVEAELYGALEAAAPAADLDRLVAVLRGFVAGLPAGEALARRIERTA